MPYNSELAQRVRLQLGDIAGVEEKKMFGGVGFLVYGNMACGVIGDNLVVRLAPENGANALAQPYTRPFDFSGRPMTGWIYVEPAGYAADRQLNSWVQQGIEFARTLPPK